MSLKYGNEQFVQIWKEDVFNTILDDYSSRGVQLDCVMNPKPKYKAINVKSDNMRVSKNPYNTQQGLRSDSVTLSGVFTEEAKLLFEGFAKKTSGHYYVDTVPFGQATSFQIFRTGINETYKTEMCRGATLTSFSLKFSGSTSTFTAKFDCFYSDNRTISSLTGFTLPVLPESKEVYLVSEMSAVSLFNGQYTDFISMDLNIKVKHINSKYLYNNSNEIENPLIEEITGDFNYSVMQDEWDVGYAEYINDPSRYDTIGNSIFQINNTGAGSTKDYRFYINGVISSITKPDPDKGVFTMKVSENIAGIGSDYALKIIQQWT